MVATAQAQGVLQDQVTVDDVLKLFDNSVAIEVEVPEGATTFELRYGVADRPLGMATFLRHGLLGAPTRLRVVVFLPDESQVNPCAFGEAEATIVATPVTANGPQHHHRQSVCVPHPPKSEIAGRPYTVLEGEAPTVDEWAPLLFHSWLVMTGRSEHGGITSAIDLERNFVVHVRFGAGNSTAFAGDPPPSLGALVELPAVAELIDDLGDVGER